jgi:large subunit ribosomal protein L9
MEVILKKDVDHLGFIDDIVNVKAGYARNFLIPKKLAVYASQSEKKILEENLRQKEQKNQLQIKGLEKVKNQIENLKLSIKSKVGEDNKLFGSVNSATIEKSLAENDISIDKKFISINNTNIIKTTGSFSAKVRLHRDLIVELNFEVVSE